MTLYIITGIMIFSIISFVVHRWIMNSKNRINIERHLAEKYSNPKNFTKNGKYKGIY